MTYDSEILKKLGSEKVIIFSCFSCYLDILAYYLRHENFTTTRYDGSMTPPEKEEALRMFKLPLSSEKRSPRVILMTFQSAGLGLNLVCANHVSCLVVCESIPLTYSLDHLYRPILESSHTQPSHRKSPSVWSDERRSCLQRRLPKDLRNSNDRTPKLQTEGR